MKGIGWNKRKNALLVILGIITGLVIASDNWITMKEDKILEINFKYYPGYESNPIVQISTITFLIVALVFGILAILILRFILSFIYSIVFIEKYVTPPKRKKEKETEKDKYIDYFNIYSYEDNNKESKLLSHNFVQQYNKIESMIFQIYLLLTVYSSLLLMVYLLNQYINYQNTFTDVLKYMDKIQLMILMGAILAQIGLLLYSFIKLQDNIEYIQKVLVENLTKKKEKLLNTIDWEKFENASENSEEGNLMISKIQIVNQFIESESKVPTWFVNKSFIVTAMILLVQLVISIFRNNIEPILTTIKEMFLG